MYLRSTPEVCYERLKKRGRKEEESVQLVRRAAPHVHRHALQAYLNTLHARYEDWLFTKSVDPTFSVPVLVRRCARESAVTAADPRRQPRQRGPHVRAR